jgi:mono/diheme cytochrome c family protein
MRIVLLALLLGLQLSCASNQPVQFETTATTDRQRDGLAGPVKIVLIEDVILTEKDGHPAEGQHAVSATTFDANGARTGQAPATVYFDGGFAVTQHDPGFSPSSKGARADEPVAGSPNKWVRNYNDTGLVIEKALIDGQGKETERDKIAYETDSHGNWVKRTTTRIAKDGSTFESEVSYRTITYYGDPSNDAAEIPATARQLKRAATGDGRVFYIQRCAVCHGTDGKSQTDLARVTGALQADMTATKLSDGELYWIVTNGVPGRGMPAFQRRTTDDERWRAVSYIRQLARDASRPQTSPAQAARSTPQPEHKDQRYGFKGKVIAVDAEHHAVTVEHDEVKGYMGAMTMPFPLKDEKLYNVLKVGDQITATLVVGESGWWLEGVKVMKQ